METQRFIMQRDTNAWRLQVGVTFVLALGACAIGVLQLPSQDIEVAFLASGFLFSLFANFTVAKTVRDNRDGQVDTGVWIMAVWIAFAAAMGLTAWGMWRLSAVDWQKAYIVVSWLFLISNAFTVAKTIRDGQEADLMDRAGSVVPSSETYINPGTRHSDNPSARHSAGPSIGPSIKSAG